MQWLTLRSRSHSVTGQCTLCGATATHDADQSPRTNNNCGVAVVSLECHNNPCEGTTTLFDQPGGAVRSAELLAGGRRVGCRCMHRCRRFRSVESNSLQPVQRAHTACGLCVCTSKTQHAAAAPGMSSLGAALASAIAQRHCLNPCKQSVIHRRCLEGKQRPCLHALATEIYIRAIECFVAVASASRLQILDLLCLHRDGETLAKNLLRRSDDHGIDASYAGRCG